MLTPLILTDCGERQDHLRAGVAMELIPIETGTFTGEVVFALSFIQTLKVMNFRNWCQF